MFVLEQDDIAPAALPRDPSLVRWLDVSVALSAYAVAGIGDQVRGFDGADPDTLRSRHPETLATIADDPFAWYTAERANLVGAVERAGEHGHAGPAWQLAHALASFFEVRGEWEDWSTRRRACGRRSPLSVASELHCDLPGVGWRPVAWPRAEHQLAALRGD